MSVSNAVKAKLISDYIGTAAGRAKLAASMTQPLRLRRDYMAVGRKTFLVEQLPDGALPIYDKDPDVTAFVVGEEGEEVGVVSLGGARTPIRVPAPILNVEYLACSAPPVRRVTQILEIMGRLWE